MMDKYEKELAKNEEIIKLADKRVNIWSLLFADYNKCSGSNHTEEDTKILQEALQLIYDWTGSNGMHINSSKTFGMRIGTAKYNTTYKAPDNTEIQLKDELKDLGIVLSSDGSFKDHIKATRIKSF